MDFKERFSMIRKALKKSQSDLAKILGVDQKTISHWETGRNEPPLEALRTFSNLFKININWLLTGKGYMFQEEPKITELKQALVSFGLKQEEANLVVDELLSRPVTLGICLKLLEAKRGNKKAFEELQSALTGMELMFETPNMNI
jgi:transcriptional regulator with XRE-family HTH domain